MASLFALCALHFLLQGEYVSSVFTAFATAFLLVFPRLRRAMVDRTLSSVFPFAGQKPSRATDDTVIEGEFREKKE